MVPRNQTLQAAILAAFAVTLAACEAKKSSNPLSPSVAGPIAGVDITSPRVAEPTEGVQFRESDQPIRLVIENSSSTGVRPLSYTFEVATDEAFNARVFLRQGVPPGASGRTTVQLEPLELGRTYFWRVRADDGANNSTFTSSRFELLHRTILTVPSPRSPVNNEQVSTPQPVLRTQSSQFSHVRGTVSYFFIVARDQAFTQVMAYGFADHRGGDETAWTVDRALEAGTTHFWRVRASDGETTTDWSRTEAFRTAPAPAPAPGPDPSPGPGPGGTCSGSTAQQIVACERSKFGHMSHGQMFLFMRATAQSLNRNNIPGGPYGILRKRSGTNCNGYSCDVICAGQGNSQRQWDVLGDIDDAQSPGWGGPNRVPDIRVDVCEVQ